MTVHHRLVHPEPDTTNKNITLNNIQSQLFDYIIIGGGTSGCLLASRLASSFRTKPSILLIEAGGESEEDPDNLIPGLTVPKFGSEAGNWLYETAAQKELNGRKIVYPRGKGMGGSSANNFSSWVRGPRCDWDAWAERVGDAWWGWENSVEVMKGLEAFRGEVPGGMAGSVSPVKGMHFGEGPIGVGTGAEWQGLIEPVLRAAQEVGHVLNRDHNDGEEMGVSVAQMNVDRGVRRNAADAFLGTVEERGKVGNVRVVTRALCKRVLFEGKKAVGVELLPASVPADGTDGEPVVVRCGKEIVLSAGTFETAHILLLSGVGPSAQLAEHGIPLIHDSPNVGRNIRDHCAFSIECTIDPTIAGHNQLLKSPSAMEAARRQYEQFHTGPLAVFGASAVVLFSKIPELYQTAEFKALPHEQQSFLANARRPSTELWIHGGPLFHAGKIEDDDSIIAIEGLCQNLLSKGSLVLRSADPRELPLIDPAYCTEPFDWRITIETIKVQLRLADAPALKAIIRKPLHGPGVRQPDGSVKLCEPDDETAIDEFLRETLTQGFHSMGSCVMGKEGDKERVVDAEFRVDGLDGLRIADMSVCPILTNNHTQINAYLIAERCAQVMLGGKGEVGHASG